jgi:cell division protein FtsB
MLFEEEGTLETINKLKEKAKKVLEVVKTLKEENANLKQENESLKGENSKLKERCNFFESEREELSLIVKELIDELEQIDNEK